MADHWVPKTNETVIIKATTFPVRVVRGIESSDGLDLAQTFVQVEDRGVTTVLAIIDLEPMPPPSPPRQYTEAESSYIRRNKALALFGAAQVPTDIENRP
jgi:hypothetical protein